MYFDTHCHLNFQAFDNQVREVIDRAKQVGVDQIVIPGTDLPTSEKAIKIAEKYDGVYAAVGIHPHHVFEIFKQIENRKLGVETGYEDRSKNLDKSNLHFNSLNPHLTLSSNILEIEKLLANKKVVAIGEIGIDRHIYQKTKYPEYKIEEEFVELQKEFFIEQIKLAHQYKKSLIIHNREAKKDVLGVLSNIKDLSSNIKAVFHCCEPDPELLEFAKKHKMFVGVDGDIFYYKEKQEWIKTVPLEMLVLETDSPFLSPTRQFPNEPKNIKVIAEFIAKLKDLTVEEISKKTTENARRLFKVQ